MLLAIQQQPGVSEVGARWDLRRLSAYWVLMARDMLRQELPTLLVQGDPLLGNIPPQTLQQCLSEYNNMMRPSRAHKVAAWLQQAELLFVRDGYGWSLRDCPAAPQIVPAAAAPQTAAPPADVRTSQTVFEENAEDDGEASATDAEDGDGSAPRELLVPEAVPRPMTTFDVVTQTDVYNLFKRSPGSDVLEEQLAGIKDLHLLKFPFSAFDAVRRPGYNWEHLFFFRGMGSFIWNTQSQKPAPHLRRVEGFRHVVALQGNSWESLAQWSKSLGLSTATENVCSWWCQASDAFPVLATWMRRRSLWSSVSSLNLVDKAHFAALGFAVEKSYVGKGRGYWIQVQLADRAPLQEPWKVGWHGTSLYCLNRVVVRDRLEVGMAENVRNGKTYKGFFLMEGKNAHCCDGYMHYTSLADDGWLYSPLLCVDFDDEGQKATGVASVLKVSGGADQRCFQPDYVRLRCVYVHMIHVVDFHMFPKDCWLTAEPGFHRALELDPDEDWEVVAERSFQRRLHKWLR
jgi:hypothetical protein